MPKVNYWKIKQEDLIGLCDLYQIPYDKDNFDRKEIIPQIVEKHAQAGKLTGAVAFDEEGNEVDITKEKETFDIIFNQQEGATKYVFLGHNGVALYLPREVRLRLPIKFKHVIDDSVQVKVLPAHDQEGRSKGTKVVRVPRFSYQILSD